MKTKPVSLSAQISPEALPADAGAALGRLVGRAEGGGYLIDVGGRQRVADADDDVDPALLAQVLARRGRVVVHVDAGAVRPVIVGVLQTSRTLEIGRDGRLIAELDELALTARRILLRAPRTFVQLADGGIELFGDNVLTRARALAKTLAAMIKFN